VVQRRVGQHDAEPVHAGGDGPGHQPAAAAWRKQDNRGGGAAQDRGGLVGNVAKGPDHVEVARHHRERLPRAALALPQAGDGVGVGGVAGELEAAQALDREDLAAHQQARRAVHGIERGDGVERERAAVAAFQPGARAAGMAGDRLRVEAAVVRRPVLGGAGGAEVERPHRGSLPVVGNALDDRQPRAAMGAVGERVAVAPLKGVERLGAALRAGRGIRDDAGACARSGARHDAECGVSGQR